jgi:hypothetical protein
MLVLAVPATASAARFQGRATGNSAKGYVPGTTWLTNIASEGD